MPQNIARCAAYTSHVANPLQLQVLEFVVRRLEQILVDSNVSVEAVRAALAERSSNPCLAASTARDLQVDTTLLSSGQSNFLY